MGQSYCSSCGSPIPDGQGKSCSMCYGDVDHGRDGYYRQMLEEQIQQEYEEAVEREEHWVDTEPSPHKDDF